LEEQDGAISSVLQDSAHWDICFKFDSYLYSKKTDWNYFKEILDKQLTLTVPLKTEIDIEKAVEDVTKAMASNPG